MTASEDLIALYKQMYSDQIRVSYEYQRALKNCITVDSGGAEGISKTYPLIGARKGYKRAGGEMVQPRPSKTSNVIMTFETFEDAEMLPFTDQAKIKNPNYIPNITKNIAGSIIQLEEQAIINALAAPKTIKAADQAYDNIDNSLQIMGDGSSRAGATLVEADLKPFVFDTLTDIKTLFDNMGVAMEDRFLYLSPGIIKVLLKEDRFVNSLYTPEQNLSKSGTTYTSTLGFTIMQAQLNPEGGLPKGKLGSTDFVTSFAFTRDSVIIEANSGSPIADMWEEKKNQSWMFHAGLRVGAVTQVPAKVIQIPTTSIK